MEEGIEKCMSKLDCNMIGMELNEQYAYLLSRFNKGCDAFDKGLEVTEKREMVFRAIIRKLAEVEFKIKNKTC